MWLFNANAGLGVTIDANANIDSDGNITAPFYFGDGSQLTGISSGGIAWSQLNDAVPWTDVNVSDSITISSILNISDRDFNLLDNRVVSELTWDNNGVLDGRYLQLDGSNSPTVNIDWGGQDLTNAGAIRGTTLGVTSQYDFPVVDGASNEYLKTDGSGTASWDTLTHDEIGNLTWSTAGHIIDTNIDLGSNLIINLGLSSGTLTDAASVEYVNTYLSGFVWQNPIDSFTNEVDANCSSGSEKHIADSNGVSWIKNNIYDCNRTGWDETVPTQGFALYDANTGFQYNYNGSEWVKIGSSQAHNSLTGLQGGQAGEYWHLKQAEYNNLFFIGTNTTDDVDEGTTNLYYSTPRVDARFDVDQTVDGVFTFSNNVVQVNTPINDNHLANKSYVDSLLAGLEWKKSVISKSIETPPISPSEGDRYIIATPGTFFDGWNYREKLTIDHTKVSSNLTNFPVLFDFNSVSDSNIFTYSKSNCFDLLVTSDDGLTQLSHEVELCDKTPASENIVLWVRVPDLSSSVDTDLYVYFGNAGSSDQSNSSGVWDANYSLVQHLEETSGTVYDSTSNDNDGTPVGVILDSVGKIDGADSFDGSNDYTTLTSSNNITGNNLQKATYSAWVKFVSTPREYITALKRSSSQSTLIALVANYDGVGTGSLGVLTRVNADNTHTALTFDDDYDDDAWHYLVATINDLNRTIFIDGDIKSSDSSGMASVSNNTASGSIGSFTTTSFPYGGLIDDVRFSKTVRSDDWIATEYNNQNSPNTFYSKGVTEIPDVNSGVWAGKINQITTYQGGSWTFVVPQSGYVLWVTDENKNYIYNSQWVEWGSAENHNSLSGLDIGDYQHLTQAEHNELNNWMDTAVLSSDGGINIVDGDFQTTNRVIANQIVANGTGVHPTGIGYYNELYMLGNVGRFFTYNGSSYGDTALGSWNGGDPNIYMKVGGNTGFGKGNPAYNVDVNSYVNVGDGYCIGGDCITSWIDVNGSSSGDTNCDGVSCNVINTGTLDGQEGTYYLDYNNFTNTPDFNEANFYTQAELNSGTVGSSGSSLIGIAGIGEPTYNDLQSHINNTFSAGVINGFELTDSGSGEIDVNIGTGMIRGSDSSIAPLLQFDFIGKTNLSLTNNKANWIYIDYNSGTPDVFATLTLDSLTFNDDFVIGRVYRDDDELHIIHAGNYYNNNPHIMGFRLWEIYGMQRASGMVTSEIGTRNVAITSGVFYLAQKRFTTTAFDSSGADDFTLWYRDGGVGWTELTGQTQISNTEYDDGDGTLGTVLPNQYGVFWVYIHDDGDVHVIMGQDSYKLAEALDSVLPSSLPSKVTTTGFFIARITIERDEVSSFTDVGAPWETAISSASVEDHGDLAGLEDNDHTQYVLWTDGNITYVKLNDLNDLIDANISGEFVPYSNADQNVDLGDYNLNSKSITTGYNSSFSSADSSIEIKEYLIGDAGGIGFEAKAGLIVGTPDSPFDSAVGIADDLILLDIGDNDEVSILFAKQDISNSMGLTADFVNDLLLSDQSFVPEENNDLDLGTSSLNWRNGYFSGDVNMAKLSTDFNSTFGNSDQNLTLGSITFTGGLTETYPSLKGASDGMLGNILGIQGLGLIEDTGGDVELYFVSSTDGVIGGLGTITYDHSVYKFFLDNSLQIEAGEEPSLTLTDDTLERSTTLKFHADKNINVLDKSLIIGNKTAFDSLSVDTEESVLLLAIPEIDYIDQNRSGIVSATSWGDDSAPILVLVHGDHNGTGVTNTKAEYSLGGVLLSGSDGEEVVFGAGGMLGEAIYDWNTNNTGTILYASTTPVNKNSDDLEVVWATNHYADLMIGGGTFVNDYDANAFIRILQADVIFTTGNTRDGLSVGDINVTDIYYDNLIAKSPHWVKSSDGSPLIECYMAEDEFRKPIIVGRKTICNSKTGVCDFELTINHLKCLDKETTTIQKHETQNALAEASQESYSKIAERLIKPIKEINSKNNSSIGIGS